MNTAPTFLAAALRVTWKELRTSFRDRQTTLYTFVLPIVLYPFVFWCMIQASLFLEGRGEITEVAVGIAAPDTSLVPSGLAEGLERDPPPSSGRTGEVASGPAPARSERNRLRALPLRALDEEGARAWITGRSGDEAGGEAGEEQPDAVVLLQRGESGDRDGLRILYDSTRTGSEIALARIRRRVPAYVRDLRTRAANEADPDGGPLEPFVREQRNIAPRLAVGAYILSHVLPVLFVLMTVMGAFFPAVDLTCGERERKTTETTMLLPIPRSAVHLGKILAVCLAGLIAMGLNLAALALSAQHLLRMLPAGASLEVSLPLGALLQVAPLLLLFAFFVSSVLTGVAALARTFKEGQALLGPVQILFVLPALAGSLPGVQITPALATVPVVNVVLCFRSLLRGEVHLLGYAITAVSLAVLSFAAIRLSLWMLSRESLLLSESGSTWESFRGLFRSPKGAR